MQHFNSVPVVDYGITFAEVPDKCAVFLELGDCKRYCEGCHTPELCEPMTDEDCLTMADCVEIVESFIDEGANAVVVLGGTDCHSFKRASLRCLLRTLSEYAPVCLYSGSDDTKTMLDFALDSGCMYVKAGSYQKHCGGLQQPTTNQRFYELEQQQIIDFKERNYSCRPMWVDKTEKFWG